MTWKKVMAIWGLILAMCMFTGTASADALSGMMPVRQVPSGENQDNPAQLTIATPNSQSSEGDDTVIPVQSEAGRDYSLVVGAILLVIIVIAGVIIGTRRGQTPKAGD